MGAATVETSGAGGTLMPSQTAELPVPTGYNPRILEPAVGSVVSVQFSGTVWFRTTDDYAVSTGQKPVDHWLSRAGLWRSWATLQRLRVLEVIHDSAAV